MKNKMLVGFLIAVIIVGASSFYGGMLYGKSQSRAQNLAFGQRQGFGANGTGGLLRNGTGQARGGNRAGGGFVNGDIIAQDDKSITVKSLDGGSKIIFLSASTQISKFSAGSVSDLIVGQTVTANGLANSDGSFTAQMIQLRPSKPENATSSPQK